MEELQRFMYAAPRSGRHRKEENKPRSIEAIRAVAKMSCFIYNPELLSLMDVSKARHRKEPVIVKRILANYEAAVSTTDIFVRSDVLICPRGLQL